mgnify:CR=1 FL=1
MKKYLFSICCLLIAGYFLFPGKDARGQNEYNTYEAFQSFRTGKYKPEQLREDLNFIYRELIKYHPQLYTYSSKDNMDLLLQSLNNEINGELTIEKFYLLATQLTDRVKCSHTGIRLPADYQNSIRAYGNFFPLKLFFSKGKAFYVLDDCNLSPSISPGTEIVSINNQPVGKIISRVFNFIPSEGNNTTTKYNELNRNFAALFYYIDDSDEFVIDIKSESSDGTVTLPACRFSELSTVENLEESNRPVDFYYLEDNSIGILKVPTFGIRDMNVYFQQLDSIFNEVKIKGTQNLVVDLRDNNGGHPIFAAQLFSYLTNKDFIYFKRNEDVKDFEPLYNTMKPNAIHFDGNIFVLLNGGCLSTTGHLISLLKYYTDAAFIGEEPGTSYRCNDFSIPLTLPNTGIGLNIPRTSFETNVKGFTLNEPFPVDHYVSITPVEIINGRDTCLEVAKEIIEKGAIPQ